jgi:O-antigen biosynthesis protein
MELSIVIVNYNVKYFLEQTLLSVKKAVRNINAEVFVVDNNSVDGSVELVQEKFPWVKLMALKENTGFSRGNNVAMRVAQGEYILLLNPDTVLQEDTLEKCLEFAKAQEQFGALGVRMIDGKGKFLPESKRGLPTPKRAFYKMCGLSSMFPKSKEFGGYHLKYLDEFKSHEVEVLSGAFMWMKKSVLDKVGLLDETFFMYGEDIDLSYRISLGGGKVFYFAGTTVIHYKGESTKKKSANYVKIFYKAMVIFANKHYSKKMAGSFALFINLAIWLRAALAVISNLAKQLAWPLIDFTTIYLGFYGISQYWEHYNKYVPNFYPNSFYQYFIPAYILIIILTVFISGGYDKPLSQKRLIRGALTGSILLIVIYAFLPRDWRFSRAILGLGSAWSVLMLPAMRELIYFVKHRKFGAHEPEDLNVAIIAQEQEYHRISQLLSQSQVKLSHNIWINAGTSKIAAAQGNLDQISEIVDIFNVNTLIFSAKDIENSDIMGYMSQFAQKDLQFKIVPERSLFIIGSNSKNQPGELYTIDVKFDISKTHIKRKKRLLDIGISIAAILTFPLLLLLRNGRHLLANLPAILYGNKTLVSYNELPEAIKLPALKNGLLSPLGKYKQKGLGENISLAYARDYNVYRDLKLLGPWLFKGK